MSSFYSQTNYRMAYQKGGRRGRTGRRRKKKRKTWGWGATPVLTKPTVVWFLIQDRANSSGHSTSISNYQ
jgi:hypothetical protein